MNIIQLTEEFVKNKLKGDVSGHDWHHIDRVRNTALFLCKQENDGNSFIIELAALLHDVADAKLNKSKEEGQRLLEQFVESLPIINNEKKEILSAIATVSFNGGNNEKARTKEAQIVQDADRLDAIGAIGIARTFAYGGKSGSPIYNPAANIRKSMTEEEYRSGDSSSIQHFYEKLLKLKGLLHTDSAKIIAEKRHKLMEDYLKEFYKEWNGNYEEYFS
ncbi:HD domain-containing protein [Niallia taxi]|uniref:HD domain-containing protein n=1 Tax=Niallia taxi TaxID=2499688 RepID=A0A3S2XAH5_9BACI|nr:HD domain-containing protein [Niallia taxi]MDK8639920.1 HD domain-containing protein [Niallia taxi]RVT65467.1 HD domain-containing protein [Niallia taxi]